MVILSVACKGVNHILIIKYNKFHYFELFSFVFSSGIFCNGTVAVQIRFVVWQKKRIRISAKVWTQAFALGIWNHFVLDDNRRVQCRFIYLNHHSMHRHEIKRKSIYICKHNVFNINIFPHDSRTFFLTFSCRLHTWIKKVFLTSMIRQIVI